MYQVGNKKKKRKTEKDFKILKIYCLLSAGMKGQSGDGKKVFYGGRLHVLTGAIQVISSGQIFYYQM